MSEYGHDEAMRDLDILNGWAGGTTELGEVYDNLAAYIERLEGKTDEPIALQIDDSVLGAE